MLVGFVTIAQAQQGRVGINTITPAATLDVVANTTDATRPDAVLVPRMTAAELNAKNAAYVAAQNGALVFVTSGTGVAATKTANVTGTGFYYYDNATSLWVAVGGGAAAPRYEAIRGTTTVTTAAAYAPTATDYFIVTNSASGTILNFPNLTAADAGRTVYVFNNNAAGNNTVNNVTGIIAMTPLRGYAILWSGTTWFSLTK
ncbi:hypothetical protein [Chryseobacterium sp. Leaf405]|uniref:hypothetical protein n=1 Tax=Chryseobacterium sp. Leaf405 TaxID=1736367 RepID=UPI0010404DF7|nr:hypothetical protein [Chryseobacterium sp. Leaf405]